SIAPRRRAAFRQTLLRGDRGGRGMAIDQRVGKLPLALHDLQPVLLERRRRRTGRTERLALEDELVVALAKGLDSEALWNARSQRCRRHTEVSIGNSRRELRDLPHPCGRLRRASDSIVRRCAWRSKR